MDSTAINFVQSGSSLLGAIFGEVSNVASRQLVGTTSDITSKDDPSLVPTISETANSWVLGRWPIVLVSFFLIICLAGTGYNGFMHLQNYTKPRLQNHVLRIIVVAPIYCTGAFISFVYPSGDMVVSAIRDIWEAIVVYAFLMLIMEYMGGEHGCMQGIQNKEEATEVKIFPLNLLYGPVSEAEMIRLPKRLTLQFVIMKPVMAVLEIIFYYHKPSPVITWIIFFIYNISYTLALAGLFLIYKVTKGNPRLQGKRLLSKFLSVKSVIFLIYWQNLFLPWIISGNTKVVSCWENFILSFESFIFTFCMMFAFTFKEFWNPPIPSTPSPSKDRNKTFIHFNNNDLTEEEVRTKNVHDDDKMEKGSSMMEGKLSIAEGQSQQKGTGATSKISNFEEPQWLKNAVKAFNPTDIVSDAHISFSSRYVGHVMLHSDSRRDSVSESNTERRESYCISPAPMSPISPLRPEKRSSFSALSNDQNEAEDYDHHSTVIDGTVVGKVNDELTEEVLSGGEEEATPVTKKPYSMPKLITKEKSEKEDGDIQPTPKILPPPSQKSREKIQENHTSELTDNSKKSK